MSNQDDIWRNAFDDYYLRKNNNLGKDIKIVYLNGNYYSQEYILREVPYKYNKKRTFLKYVEYFYLLKK